MMVLIDFPQDKSRVPAKYVERNNALQKELAITSFPTFVILDQDGVTELGRLGAGPKKTPASFQSELKGLLRYRSKLLSAYCASIGEEQAAAYRALLAELVVKKVASKEADKALIQAEIAANSKKGAIVNHEKRITAFLVGQLGKEKRAAYDKLEAKRDDMRAEYLAWRRTRPEPGEETTRTMRCPQLLQRVLSSLGGCLDVE